MRRAFFAAIAVSLLGGASVAAADEPAAAVEKPLPGWLTLGKPAPEITAASMYERLLRDDIGRRSWLTKAEIADRLASDTSFRFVDRNSEFETLGENASIWTFFNPTNQRWPTAALRLRFTSSEKYEVVAEIYCDAGAGNCPEAQIARAAVRAPKPPYPSPGALDKAWEAIVIHEDCTPGATMMNAPSYPPEELRRGIGGVVRLQILINPCGEMRRVFVATSSGNSNLDRSALRAAARWRTYTLTKGVGGTYQVPIRFSPDFPSSSDRHDGPAASGASTISPTMVK